ncbi:hypothetical protein C6P44_004184 [Monosporozyma unispora]|nr:hypothetical protein C6P44_004184 [Kazachstania unispora]
MGSHSSKNESGSNVISRSLSDGNIFSKFKHKRSKTLKDTTGKKDKHISIKRKVKSLRLSRDKPERSPTSRGTSNVNRKNEIAKRKIMTSDSGENINASTNSSNDSYHGPFAPNGSNNNINSIKLNASNDTTINLPTIKLDPPYQLPEIESIKSNKSKDRYRDINEPRRSLQNSIAGITKIHHHHHHKHTRSNSSNTHVHGFFNIPVTIDNHLNDTDSDSEDMASPLSEDSNKAHSNKGTNVTSTPEKVSDNEDTNNSTSILGTIMSIAHTAMSYVPKVNGGNNILPSSLNNSTRDITSGPGSKKSGSAININNSINTGRSVNAANNDSISQLHNDTVVHNQLPSSSTNFGSTNSLITTDCSKSNIVNKNSNTKADNGYNNPDPHRSTSFLRHLDSLLSPGNQILASQTSSSSLVSKDNLNNGDGISMTNTNTRYTNDPSEHTSLNKVKFESINSLNSVSPDPPAIDTLGHGDLTLDIFDDKPTPTHIMSNDSLVMSNNTSAGNNNILNIMSDTALAQPRERENSLVTRNVATPLPHQNISATNRNSSYIDVSKHNPLVSHNRERSKTLPTKELAAIENAKRNSRYSSLSNDEHLVVNSNNNNGNNAAASNIPTERKSRSMSRNFLGRRSFSPNIAKVIPNINLKTSINKTRNSTDISESRGVSSSFDTMMDPVVNIDYNKPSELKGVEYSSEKKNAEFHNLFKDTGISPDEKLIIDHSCALSRDILLQGRIYISNQHLCFYSNILGWVSTVVIPFKEIVQIEKKTTAGIFPNGIVIDTLHSKYIFASFISRDATFDLITDVWNQIILGRRYIKAVDSNENFSDLHSNFSLTNSSGHSSFDDMDIDDMDDDDDDDDDDVNDTDMTSSDELDDDSIVASGKRSKTNTVTAVTPNFPGPATHAPTNFDYKPVTNERLTSELKVDAPLGQVAQILYGDDTKRLSAILKAQDNFDLSPIPPLLKTKTRDYFYFKPLHFGFGPNKTKCLIVDKVLNYDLENYVQVIQESKTPDVPSGNSFTIRTNTILTWDVNNSTKVTTYFLCEWTSKSWLKSAIEKGAFDGVIETTKTQVNEIIKYVKEDKSKSPTRRGFSQSKKSKSGENDDSEKGNSLPTLGPATHEPTEPEYLKGKDDVIIEKEINFNVPLGTVFQLLYGDDTSYLKQIVEKQDTFDISELPKFVNNEREYKYTKRLKNSMGPKQTKCTIKEKIEHMDINHYICVRQTVVSHDVPYGNTFTVHTRSFYSWGPNNTTKLLVVLNVVWSGKCFIKGTVEKGCIDGQKSGTAVVIEQLNSIISNLSKKKSKKRSKTVRSRSTTTVKPSEPTQHTDTMESTTEVSGSMLGSVFSLWEDFDLFSIKGIITLIICLFAFVWLFRSIFSSSTPQSSVQLIGQGRLLIDGNEYTYVPNFKTLYQVYEDEIKQNVKTKKKEVLKNRNNVVVSSRKSITSWLKQRGYGFEEKDEPENTELDGSDNDTNKKTSKTDKEIKRLMESIKITELQLDEMKDTLSSLQS